MRTPNPHARPLLVSLFASRAALVAPAPLATAALVALATALGIAPDVRAAGAPSASAPPIAPASPPPLANPAGDAGAPRISKTPPDPPPLLERAQWVFDLRYARGDLFLLGVHAVDLGTPQRTPRAMGRFAIELYEGAALVERVRFDFPFLGAADPRFEAKLVTRIGVMFPATKRGTRLELCDRATEQRWPLPWPPAPEPVTDAGADAAPARHDGG